MARQHTSRPRSQRHGSVCVDASVFPLHAVDKSQELLQYPPRPMPAGSCTCRLDMNKTRIPMDCPSPWSTPAGTTLVSSGGAMSDTHAVCVGGCCEAVALSDTSQDLCGLLATLQVPPALQIAPDGALIEEKSGNSISLRGINWFGWSVGSYNFDGLFVRAGSGDFSFEVGG